MTTNSQQIDGAMTTHNDLVGRRYPMKRGGYLEVGVGQDGHWLHVATPEEATADSFHVRYIPAHWLLALTPAAMAALIKDFGDRGIGWGMAGTDAASSLERMRREDSEMEWLR